MKKRSNAVVILSSDDDDDDNNNSNKNNNIKKNRSYSANSKSNRSNSIPKSSNAKSRGSSAKTTSSKKRARVSQSLSSSVELFSTFDDLKFLSEDFAEGFAGFKVSTGSKKVDGAESWVDKYRPCSLDDLAVHKKKVEEVKVWLEDKLNNSELDCRNYVLIITGQAGIGKSATIRAAASHLGAEVCEWNTPTPTLWQEHVHNSNAGLRYISKLDEFENFVERVRKYGVLSPSCNGPRPSMILFIEDIPVANGKVAQGKLHRCLQLLVKSVKIPTVILITEYSGADSADLSMRYWDEVSSTLESSGACKVAFNPITTNSLKKALARICVQEQCNTASEQIDTIANASGGDIRHAIMTLQYVCLRQQKMERSSSDRCSPEPASGLHPVEEDTGLSLRFGRDQTLSLFHALGKFLHNKRETDSTMDCNENFYMKEGFTRLPLKMDAPEKVLSQAYGQARPVAEFLQENVLDFLGQEAIEDASAVASYLSDTDYLLSSGHRAFSRNYISENVIQSAAASVAVRGVLFGNAHPSPSRWHAIRRPMLWQVEQSARRNMLQIERQRLDTFHGQSLSSASIIVTEYKPALKWLGYKASSCSQCPNVGNNSMQDDELGSSISIDQSSECTDDEIEDC